jgi:hypothetical protein
MSETGLTKAEPNKRRTIRVLVACLSLFALGGLATIALVRWHRPESSRSDTDVPLGVEQAVIIRSSGPQLKARPYRRGASVNLRIADMVRKGPVRVYDIRYVVSLPGEFDLTEYLTSTDGRSIDDLPSFKVRGLTSLTKDIETRIQEIENVGVHVWHWYYETLIALGAIWLAWLAGLIFIGRPPRPPRPPSEPMRPSVAEQIGGYLELLSDGELTTEQKAHLEALLLQHWRGRLGLADRRMAASCRDIEDSDRLGRVYHRLQAWLHNPRANVGADEFVEAYQTSHGTDGPTEPDNTMIHTPS